MCTGERAGTLLILGVIFAGDYGYAAPCTIPVLEESGACYWLSQGEATWADAWSSCSSQDGTLAIVPTQAVFEGIGISGLTFWIGASELVTPGVYRWVDGRAVTWTNWATDQPDNKYYIQHCLSMDEDGWYDDFCLDKKYFLCQSIPTDFYCQASDPLCAPWVNVAYSNRLPATVCSYHNEFEVQLDGSARDVDCDTLCQRATHFICRSAEVGEVCGGSALSVAEMESADCLKEDPDTDMHIWSYDPPYDESTSILHNSTDALSWWDATASCEKDGLQLLTVKSPLKDALLGNQESWLALTDADSLGTYKWQDGTYPVYQNWNEDVANTDPAANCAYRGSNGYWIDRNCSDIAPFICETINTATSSTTSPNHVLSTSASLTATGENVISQVKALQDFTTDCECFGQLVGLAVAFMVGMVTDVILAVYILRKRMKICASNSSQILVRERKDENQSNNIAMEEVCE